MRFLQSIIFLLRIMIVLVFKRTFFRRNQEEELRAQFEPEGIFSLTQEQRDEYHEFSRCINCGLCESSLPVDEGTWGQPRFLFMSTRDIHELKNSELNRVFPSAVKVDFVCPVSAPFFKLRDFVKSICAFLS